MNLCHLFLLAFLCEICSQEKVTATTASAQISVSKGSVQKIKRDDEESLQLKNIERYKELSPMPYTNENIYGIEWRDSPEHEAMGDHEKILMSGNHHQLSGNNNDLDDIERNMNSILVSGSIVSPSVAPPSYENKESNIYNGGGKLRTSVSNFRQLLKPNVSWENSDGGISQVSNTRFYDPLEMANTNSNNNEKIVNLNRFQLNSETLNPDAQLFNVRSLFRNLEDGFAIFFPQYGSHVSSKPLIINFNKNCPSQGKRRIIHTIVGKPIFNSVTYEIPKFYPHRYQNYRRNYYL